MKVPFAVLIGSTVASVFGAIASAVTSLPALPDAPQPTRFLEWAFVAVVFAGFAAAMLLLRWVLVREFERSEKFEQWMRDAIADQQKSQETMASELKSIASMIVDIHGRD